MKNAKATFVTIITNGQFSTTSAKVNCMQTGWRC